MKTIHDIKSSSRPDVGVLPQGRRRLIVRVIMPILLIGLIFTLGAIGSRVDTQFDAIAQDVCLGGRALDDAPECQELPRDLLDSPGDEQMSSANSDLEYQNIMASEDIESVMAFALNNSDHPSIDSVVQKAFWMTAKTEDGSRFSEFMNLFGITYETAIHNIIETWDNKLNLTYEDFQLNLDEEMVCKFSFFNLPDIRSLHYGENIFVMTLTSGEVVNLENDECKLSDGTACSPHHRAAEDSLYEWFGKNEEALEWLWVFLE